MNGLAALLQFAGFALLPALAVFALARAAIGNDDPRAPRCGSCREPLGFAEMATGRPCRACGATTADSAPTPTRRRPARRALVVGIALLALAIPTAWLGHAVQRRRATAPPSLALVPAMLAPGSPLVDESEELIRAVRRGDVEHADLRAALAAALANPPKAIETSVALNLAELALEDSNASRDELDAHWATVLAALEPEAIPERSFLESARPYLTLDPTSHLDAWHRVGLVLVLRRARVDDREVPLEEFLGRSLAPDEPLFLPLSIRPLPPGPHTLRLSFETFLYSAFDLERIGVGDTRRMRESDWPAPLATRRFDATVPFTAP